MRFLKDAGIPPPRILYNAAEFVLNTNLRRSLENRELNPKAIKALLEEARIEGITLDLEILEYSFRKNINQIGEEIFKNPEDLSLLKQLDSALGLLPHLPFKVNLGMIQNLFYDLLQEYYPRQREKVPHSEWVRIFTSLCAKLSLLVH